MVQTSGAAIVALIDPIGYIILVKFMGQDHSSKFMVTEVNVFFWLEVTEWSYDRSSNLEENHI